MARFRNLFVDMNARIDPVRGHEILCEHENDLRMFAQAVAGCIARTYGVVLISGDISLRKRQLVDLSMPTTLEFAIA